MLLIVLLNVTFHSTTTSTLKVREPKKIIFINIIDMYTFYQTNDFKKSNTVVIKLNVI